MRPMSVVRAVALSSLLFAYAAEATARAADSRGTTQSVLLQNAAHLEGTKAGVDVHEHLWFWNADERKVVRISPAGEDVASSPLPEALSVDVDSVRGIAALVDGGRAVAIVAWDGRVTASVRLPDLAGDIAWGRGSLVAVTPHFADHRIALWDMATGKLVQKIGDALPISRGPGQHLARATLVRYDAGRGQLIALDGTFGRLFIYDETGAQLRSDRIVAPPPPVHEWLSHESDDRESRTVVLWRYSVLSVASDGSVWISGAGDERDAIALLRSSDAAGMQTIPIRGVDCIRPRAVIWRDVIVLFRDPQIKEQHCAAVVAYPEMSSEPAPAVQLGGLYPSPRPRAPRLQPNATTGAYTFELIEKGWSLINENCSCSAVYWCAPAGEGWATLPPRCKEVENQDRCDIVCTWTRMTESLP